jgi:ribosomal silencing factor RsfS
MLAPVRALYNLEELWNFETKPAADADSENPAA